MAAQIDSELKEKLLSTLIGGLMTDGGHHKQHELETAVKLLTGCPTITVEATDYKGKPYSYETLGESEEYLALRRAQLSEEDLAYYLEMGYTAEDISEIEPWEEGIPG